MKLLMPPLLLLVVPVFADQSQCQKVRFADIGWTDVSATTAVAAVTLESLGYQTKIDLLSMPVTFASLKNNDIDVFMGNWMPTEQADIEPYLKNHSVVQLNKNLEGAKFTLAVPKYVYDAGVKSLADLARFKEQLGGRIFGIEPGNDGNRIILKIIQNEASLKGWRLVESSEQGMLVEVKRAIAEKKWIVFLGWAPHPMNQDFAMEYLSGSDAYFGSNFGEAKVFTVVRQGLSQECPQLTAHLKSLVFTVGDENQLMSLITNQHLTPREAAKTWLNGNKKTAQVERLKVGEWAESFIQWMTTRFAKQFREMSTGVQFVVTGLAEGLKQMPPGIVIAAVSLIIFFLKRSLVMALMTAAGLGLIANLGLWTETIDTLVLVLLSSSIAVLIGVPIGIIAARRPLVFKVVQPLLDLMQTVPTFVYLIPTLMLFGLGVVPGLLSTVIFALPASIRLTHLGLIGVPLDLVEAAEAFGASSWQKLIKVEIPHALPCIVQGVTQTIMLSLSMVVIAALVGADGLGTTVVRALNTVNIRQGFEAGLAIVILAILLDRAFRLSRPRSS